LNRPTIFDNLYFTRNGSIKSERSDNAIKLIILKESGMFNKRHQNWKKMSSYWYVN